jgi:hypothetical protein
MIHGERLTAPSKLVKKYLAANRERETRSGQFRVCSSSSSCSFSKRKVEHEDENEIDEGSGNESRILVSGGNSFKA